MKKVIYEGIFLNKEEVLEIARRCGGDKRLAKVIENPHITTRYRPIYTLDSLYGTECDVIITAHGNNGKNEGLKVIAVCANDMVNSMISDIKYPHVTVSIAEDAKAVDTADLIKDNKVKRCANIFKVRGVFGAFTTEGVDIGKEEL